MDKPLQRIDHIMWDAEAPNSLATIAGVMTFRKPLNKDRMVEMIRKRLMKYDRFQKTVIIKNGSPMWHQDENFRLLSHIHHIALPGKGGYKELQECISDLISQPLNYHKPLWDIHLIDNYNGGSALLWRVHHVIGDGIALVKVIFSLTGISAADSLAVFGEEDEKPKKAKDKIDYAIDLGMSMYEEARMLLNNPSILKDTLQSYWNLTKEAGELFKSAPKLNEMYKGNLGMTKIAAWTEPLPLRTFKKLSKYHDAKINDIMLSLVAGAFRRHLLHHKQKIKEGIKVVMPVNIRSQGKASSLHNDFSFITVDLPIHMSSFEKRLAFIKKRTTALKPTANSLLMTEAIHIVADYTPLAVKQKMFGYMGKTIVGVVTNVPGPQHTIYLAGGKVEDLMFWVPHTVPLGVGVSLMSYNGKVHMGIVTDDILVKDPDMIVRAFAGELRHAEKLMAG